MMLENGEPVPVLLLANKVSRTVYYVDQQDDGLHNYTSLLVRSL